MAGVGFAMPIPIGSNVQATSNVGSAMPLPIGSNVQATSNVRSAMPLQTISKYMSILYRYRIYAYMMISQMYQLN